MQQLTIDVRLCASDLPHLPTPDLCAFHARASEAYAVLRAADLKLDLTRGKPSPEQLDLSNDLFAAVGSANCTSADGSDCRNYYGSPQGLPEARALFADLLGAPADQVVVANNSSLSLMHDVIVYALLTGAREGGTPWSRHTDPIWFLCPVPGYDRHFAICQQYGIRMIPIPLTGQGPDMAEVERRVADPAVKGMWCVPKYSNPTGETYSAETVERLAAMQSGADDFRLFWDNAYAVHHWSETPDELENVLAACTRHGTPDRPLVFASTSKITFAQGGLGLLAGSPANVQWFVDRVSKRTIGPDKLNQLRHVRLLRNPAGITAHMAQHRHILAAKFAAMWDVFRERLGGSGVATWTEPRGGYFVSLDVLDGCAKRTVSLAKEAGVALVPAGQTFPYGEDPRDRNIRLAPSFPSPGEVRQAAEAVALCTLLAACERLLTDRGALP
jgi:DNA-binding transcriptional MocR family regulator